MTTFDHRKVLRQLFDVAVAAANPERAVAANLPKPPKGRTAVLSLGKAAIPMARAVAANWPGPLSGLAICPKGQSADLGSIAVVNASHPVPDASSLAAADRALALVNGLGRDDLLIALISGGGSSLMSKPLPGIAPADKTALLKTLLNSGANIGELNTVRKHLSAVKGGRLGRAANGAHIHTLILSDVPGDDPAVVASGPTVWDETTNADAQAVLRRYRIDVPPAIAAALAGLAQAPPPFRADNQTLVIVSPHESFRAVRAEARAIGLNVLYLGDRIEGESREVAKVHAAIAQEIRQYGEPCATPCLLLSGGETGVTVRGRGRGGRNVEFALSLALTLAGAPGIHALAADTDGVDGMEPIAGAILTPDTLERARAEGLDPVRHLENNDAHSFFEALGDQVITGPTQTNVNDFRAILIT